MTFSDVLFQMATINARQEFPVMHGSDVDYTDRLCGLSDADLSAREEETAREQRWAAFVAWARTASVPVLLDDVARLMRILIDPSCPYFHTPADIQQRVLDFAETEGWSGVLRAIARAMDEDAAAQRELMDRR